MIPEIPSRDPEGVAAQTALGAEGFSRSRFDAAQLARAVYLLFLLAPLPWIVISFTPPLNHDAAAILHYASRWLAGERLYVDLIDINPPLIFILNLIPAAIDRLTPLSGMAALTICVLAWIAIAFWLCWQLESQRGVGQLLLPPLLLFLMIVYPGPEFAQREHLMLVSTLPYLLLAAHRMRWDRVSWRAHANGQRTTITPRLALATAIFATLGFALKPYFLLIPLLVEACVLTRIGWRQLLRDPVPWTIASLTGLYVILIATLTPRYLDTVVPLAAAEYLNLGDPNPLIVLVRTDLLATAVLWLPLAGCAVYFRRRFATVIAAAALAAILIAMIQGKGWPYHLLPAESFALLLAGILLCDAFDLQSKVMLAQRSSARQQSSRAILVAAFMIGAYYISGMTRPTFNRHAYFDESPAGQLLKRFGHEFARGPMLVLSPGLYPHFPVVNYAGTRMAMRFMSLWPIQGVYAYCLEDGRMFRTPAEMTGPERFSFGAIIEDLTRYRPRTIIVDKYPGIPKCGATDFDILEYFRQSPVFEAGWAQYRLLGEVERYRIYRRD